MPREAIKAVRFSFLNKLGGFINSKVIMFDELELDSVENSINKENIIYEDMQELLFIEEKIARTYIFLLII